ncbi:Clp protease [Hyphomicrobium sp. B1]|uniref:Clp protease n=1 Tax=Hyphomicrobium sp. B1 TaxID=3075651 RepID=UPI003C2FA500
MAYHGEDLDLRTSQTWTPSEVILPADAALSNGKRGSLLAGPVLVDDTVLACFNQAYDIAAAHRAGEVRVEHLLNAMTRLDAAAAALETHGIRVVALKRETAAIIAGDIPAMPGSGPVSPRRSEDLAEVLKFSVALAARRNTAVSVDDLLQVLFDHRGEFGASELLLRFVARAEPLPPLTRPEPRYAAPPRYAVDYGRPLYRNEYLGTQTDALQNSRIESLEQAVRALGQDLSNERHAIASLVRDFARDTVAHQDDQGRTHALLIDRIGSLESAFREGGAAGPVAAVDTSGLVAKLGDIEAALELRLQEMSQSWSVLSTRLQELEEAIKQRPIQTEGGTALEDIRQAVDLKPISDRLDIIEEAVLGSHQSGFVELGDRLSRLEDGVGQVLATPTGDGRTDEIIGGIDRIHGLWGNIEGLSGNVASLAGNLESLTGNVAGLSDKFDGLSGKVDTHSGSLTELLTNLSERVKGAESAIAAEIETAAAKHQAYTQDLTEVHEALLKVNQNQHTLAGAMDQWRTDSASDVAAIMNRLGEIDRDTALPAETLSALNTHMDQMNKFIIERYHRRHRFMYWLFGTDDWISASWPSTKAKIETDQHRLKVVEQTKA